MIKVTVSPDSPSSVRVRTGEKNGRQWRMVEQRIWIHKPGQPYPENFAITLPDGANPYQAGDYMLDFESMLARGRFDSIGLNDRGGVHLIPVTAAYIQAYEKLTAQMNAQLNALLQSAAPTNVTRVA